MAKNKPYGRGVTFNKLECEGHVQKQFCTALRKLEQQKSETPFSDGKSIGGKGKIWYDNNLFSN